MARLWILGYGSFTVIETGTIRKLGYGFLFASMAVIFSRFDTTHECNSQPDTARRHRSRLCIASRCHNYKSVKSL